MAQEEKIRLEIEKREQDRKDREFEEQKKWREAEERRKDDQIARQVARDNEGLIQKGLGFIAGRKG